MDFLQCKYFLIHYYTLVAGYKSDLILQLAAARLELKAQHLLVNFGHHWNLLFMIR